MTNSKCDCTVAMIVLEFGDLPGLLEPKTNILQKLNTLLQSLGDRHNTNFTSII
jgi:hypothetical protein